MSEIIEEYGEFIIETISGILLIGIFSVFFLGTPMDGMIQKFITSVMGGGS